MNAFDFTEKLGFAKLAPLAGEIILNKATG